MGEFDGFAVACAAAVEAAGLDGIEVQHLGVGKTAAALGLVAALRDRRPAGVLLFGVAGAFRDSGLAPGALCVVSEDAFGDEGVVTETGFRDLGALGFGEIGPFALPAELATAASARLDAPLVRAVTVSTCSGTDAHAAEIRRRSGAAIETMEGAAVALACRQLGLPLVHLRAISNWTGDRERGAWDLGSAVSRVQRAVRDLLGY